MTKIIFIGQDGSETQVEAHLGDTVMQTAVDNLISGISAECGGGCSCATCHVVVDETWIAEVGPAEDVEKDLLESLDNFSPNSRLCCQIEVTRSLDGLRVSIPA